MMSLDDFNVDESEVFDGTLFKPHCENVGLIQRANSGPSSPILLLPHMGHIAPVVRAI